MAFPRLLAATLLLLILLPVASLQAAASTAWYDSAWQYRQKITVNHEQVAGPVDGFPMLVKLTGTVFEQAQEDGDDILFTAADGTTKLLHEIESMDGEVVAWVQMPNLSPTEDTTLYVYYGNPTVENQQSAERVWDTSIYAGAWHLNENPGVTQQDATINNNDGTPKNIDSQDSKAAGKIGSAVSFDGVNDYVDLGNTSTLNPTSALTLSAWVKYDSFDILGEDWVVSRDDDTKGRSFAFGERLNGPFNRLILQINGAATITNQGQILSTGQWYHIVATGHPDFGWRLYLDGTLDGSASWSQPNVTTGNANIGRRTYSGAESETDGVIDEVRIMNVARSSAWIKTEYNNQSGREDFLTIAEPELRSASTAATADATTTTLASPLISAINRLFTFVYDRLPTFTEWKFWADRVLAGDKTTLPSLLGAMQWQQVFGGSTPTVAGISSDAAAGLNVEIRNGTNRQGLAGRTLQKLSRAGWRVTAVGNARDFSREQSKVYVLNHSDYAEAAELGTLLSIPVGLDLPPGERESSADVLVVLGADFGE